MQPSPPDIRSLSRVELCQQLAEWRQPAYRANQVLDWLYRRRVTTWEEMTNLPKALRQKLRDGYALGGVVLKALQGAGDTTQKYLWELPDGAFVESVLIPANPALYGEPSDRHTLCLSTQVGCAYGCRFCASGLDGWKRNLGVAEIVNQVLAVESWGSGPAGRAACAPSEGMRPSTTPGGRTDDGHTRLVNNLVVMGMGEPLANYDNLLKALRILNAPWGGGIGARKVTVSTSGLVPQIRRLAEEPEQFQLAISLHGASDTIRDRIMPVNRKYPVRELLAACEYYQERKGRRITLEYILLDGVNDAPEAMRALGDFVVRLGAKVNLIPYNRVAGLSWVCPSEAVQDACLNQLQNQGVRVTLRREKGGAIDAACGQLRLRTLRDLEARPDDDV